MAKLVNLFFGVAAAGLVLSLVATPASAAAAAAPRIDAPESGDLVLPPEPYDGYYKYLDQCLKNITDECGEEIYLSIFKDRGTVSVGCCNILVDVGLECHQNILWTSVELLQPKPKKDELDRILNKSNLLWTQCVNASMPADDVELPAGSPAYSF